MQDGPPRGGVGFALVTHSPLPLPTPHNPPPHKGGHPLLLLKPKCRPCAIAPGVQELWCLLHFLMPAKFPSAEEFERKYAITTHTDQDDGGANQSRITQLHRELQPHILRRVKKDVEKSLPRKVCLLCR